MSTKFYFRYESFSVVMDWAVQRSRFALWCVVFIGAACSSRFEQSALYDQDYDALFNSSLSAAAALSWEITLANRESGFIQAKVPMNLRTFGNLVTIEIVRISPNNTRLKVSSTSSQILDWGKNSSNAEEFIKKLNRQEVPISR